MTKSIIFAAALLISFCIISCNTCNSATTDADASWNAFCIQHGYDPNTDDQRIIDQYLDTWVGSVAEEEALI